MQLLAKDLLTKYAKEVSGLDPMGLAIFAASSFASSVKERTAAGALIQRLIDARSDKGEDSDLLDRGTQLSLFEAREERVLDALGRRLRKAAKAEPDEAFRIFNNAQDHVVRAAKVHIDRVVLEAFTAGIARTEEGEAAELLREVCTLFALTAIEDDLAWFMGHNRISIPKAKEVLPLVNAQCEKIRPHTEALVEGFGVAWGALKIPILED